MHVSLCFLIPLAIALVPWGRVIAARASLWRAWITYTCAYAQGGHIQAIAQLANLFALRRSAAPECGESAYAITVERS
jgi:hypothetical protein